MILRDTNNVVDTITNSGEEINIGEGTHDKIKGRYTIPVNGVYLNHDLPLKFGYQS